MQTIFQNPTARIWFLSVLTGMVLLTGLLLGEGKARTYSPSLVDSSIPVLNKMDRPAHLSQPMPIKKVEIRNAALGKHVNSARQKDIADAKPAKKRMGLAMLFLGILGEKG